MNQLESAFFGKPLWKKKEDKMFNIPKVPAPIATFLLRVPLAILFLQQGIQKWPVDAETAEAFGLPLLVWFFVVWGEIGAGVGLLIAGIIGIVFARGILSELGDIITRFSGITMCCIMTGVIWLSQPVSFADVLFYDYLHVSLWVGGLYFALRGNAKYE